MGSALEDYGMSWMPSKIGGGGEIVVLTISTISIRLSMDGELAPSFVQKKGARQGSGLSLCIFTMPVDFAMKVADLACEELGMIGSEDEDKRGAYADDVAERTRNEEEASVSQQQFEAGGGMEA